MTLRAKTLIFAVLSVAALVALLGTVATRALQREASSAERDEVAEDTLQARNVLDYFVEEVDRDCLGWASWDEMYAFAGDGNRQFAERNLEASNFAHLDLDLAVVVDGAGRTVYVSGQRENASQALWAEVAPHVQTEMARRVREFGKASGILSLPAGAVELAVRPILDSRGHGPARGTLVFGRLVRPAQWERMTGAVSGGLSIRPYGGAKASAPRDSEPVESPGLPYIRALGPDRIAGEIILPDVYGQPMLLVHAVFPRKIHQEALTDIRRLYWAIGLTGALSMLLLLLFLEQTALARLGRLSSEVRRVGGAGHSGERIVLPGRDELSALAGELNKTLAALSETEQKYRLLAENALDVIWQLDSTGLVTYMSQSIHHLGYEPENVVGRCWEELVPPEEQEAYRGALTALFQQPHSLRLETAMLRADGTTVAMEMLATSRRESDGALTVQGIGRDITERKAAETQLRHTLSELAHSNEDLERFAYVASHDLQEPLRMITGYLELLEERYRGQLDGRAQEFIGFAVDGADRMRNLIEQLLAYSRLGRREQGAEPVDLNAVVDGVLANLDRALAETGAEVTRDPLPVILGIPGHLVQLYQNLLANALKFRGEDPVRIRLGATRLNGDWLLSVTDNGIGIAPEYHQDIFVIFRRLHTREEYAGTGLGLALCKRIAEQHGGKIWVESEPNRGTTFWFTLPAPADAH